MTVFSGGDWIFAKEAAKIIGITPAALSYHVRANKIPHRRVGRIVFILRSEAEKFRDTPRPVGRPKKS
jgi:predicted transcriptional regulator